MKEKKEICLKVKEIVYETKDTITIVFDEPALEYIPGQYLMLKIPYENKVYNRAYSLCTSPFIDEYPAVTVKRVTNGKISNLLNDTIKANDEIYTYPPKGNFTIEYKPDNQRNIMFIAAGSGITPLFSLIKSLLIMEPLSTATLVYINRNEDTIIFEKQLKILKIQFQGRFELINILTKPSNSYIGLKGRPNKNIILNIVGELPQIPNDYYLCGPSELMHMIIEVLKGIDIQKENIHWESFGENENKKQKTTLFKKQSLIKPKKSIVNIRYEDDDYTIEVQPNQTILEAALDKDIDIPFACSNGTCNVCQAKCISGKIKMDNDEGLTEEEINEGYVLTCVGRPITETVDIEFE